MGRANLKQLQSCAKSINMALIVVSKRVAELVITKEEAKTDMRQRLDGVKRRHGFQHFMEMAPFIIKKSKATRHVPLTVQRDAVVTKDYKKGDKVLVKVNIPLLPELLEDYYMLLPGAVPFLEPGELPSLPGEK